MTCDECGTDAGASIYHTHTTGYLCVGCIQRCWTELEAARACVEAIRRDVVDDGQPVTRMVHAYGCLHAIGWDDSEPPATCIECDKRDALAAYDAVRTGGGR